MANYTPVRGATSRHLEPLSELIEQIDLAELVAEAAGPGKQYGEKFTYSCPSPTHSDSTPSFTVKAINGRQRYKCYGCDASGDALDYVQWMHGLDRAEAIKYLRGRAGSAYVEAPRRATPAPTKRTPPPPRTPPLPTGTPSLDEMGRRLLADHAESRGWPIEVAEAHGLHAVTVGTVAYIRYPFHIPTKSGPIWFGWQDRRIGKGEPRWLAPSGWPLPLWGTCSLQGLEVPAVVICEGPADGITATYALAEYAGVAVVAVPGVQTWRPEWSRLFKGLHVVTAADPDPSGDDLAKRIATDLEGIAASVTTASRDLLTVDLTDALRHHGPHYVAAALLEPLHLLKVIES